MAEDQGERPPEQWRRIPLKYHAEVINFKAELREAWTFECCGRKRLPFFTFYVKKQWNKYLAYAEVINNVMILLLTIVSSIVLFSAGEDSSDNKGLTTFLGIVGFISTLGGQSLLHLWYGYQRYENPLQWFVARKSPDASFRAYLDKKRSDFDEVRNRLEILHCGRLTQSDQLGVKIVGYFVRLSNDLILLALFIIATLMLSVLYLIDRIQIWVGNKRDERKQRIEAAKKQVVENDNSEKEGEEDFGNQVTARDDDVESRGENVAAEQEIDEAIGSDELNHENQEAESEDEEGLIAATTGLKIFCISADQIIKAVFYHSGQAASIGGAILWACMYASQDFAHIQGNVSFSYDTLLGVLKYAATLMLFFNETYYEALLFRKGLCSMIMAYCDEALRGWIGEVTGIDDDYEISGQADLQKVDDIEVFNAQLATDHPNNTGSSSRNQEEMLKEDVEKNTSSYVEEKGSPAPEDEIVVDPSPEQSV